MKHILRAASLLLLAVLVVPAFAFDDPKPDEKKADKADPAAKKADDKKGEKSARKAALKKEHVVTEKTMKAGEIVGRVVSVNGTGKVLRIKVTYEIPKVNAGAVNGLAQAQQNLLQAQMKRPVDVGAILNAQTEIAKNKAQMYQTERKEMEVEVTATDEMTVRNRNPPEQFDAKGRARRLTEKEKRELKGPDTKTPGYPAEFTDLRQDQIVQVTLVRDKDAAKHAPKKAKDVEAALAPKNLHASRIMILADAPK